MRNIPVSAEVGWGGTELKGSTKKHLAVCSFCNTSELSALILWANFNQSVRKSLGFASSEWVVSAVEHQHLTETVFVVSLLKYWLILSRTHKLGQQLVFLCSQTWSLKAENGFCASSCSCEKPFFSSMV